MALPAVSAGRHEVAVSRWTRGIAVSQDCADRKWFSQGAMALPGILRRTRAKSNNLEITGRVRARRFVGGHPPDMFEAFVKEGLVMMHIVG